jgi:hypothetical protein
MRRAREVSRMNTPFRGLLCCLGTFILGASGTAISDTAEDNPSDISVTSVGRQIYREGTLPSGLDVAGLSQGDIPLSGSFVSCTNCHRRSGLGSSEGGKVVPPITARALFETRLKTQRDAFRSRSLRSRERPAYDLTSLARVLRSGIDPGGNELDPLMPRYDLKDEDIKALEAYLRTLDFQTPPGLTHTELHFATISAQNADPEDRDTVLEVLNRFFADKNADTRNESKRASHGAFYRNTMEDSYRKWKLHVWELSGAPDTWGSQLDVLYATQPVFALIGGIGEGSWLPVHEFCQSHEVPCIFPITDQPPMEEDFYSIYLTGGVPHAAQTVAQNLEHILDGGESSKLNQLGKIKPLNPASESAPPLVQVYRKGSTGESMAKSLRTHLSDSKWTIHDRNIDSTSGPSVHFWQNLYTKYPGSVLFLWLSSDDLQVFSEAEKGFQGLGPDIVVLSETVTGRDAYTIARNLLASTRVVSLYELDEGRIRSLQRLRAWLKPRGLQAKNERIQSDSYLAVTLTISAVKHMGRNFSREYLIEIIEHGLDNTVFRSVYPRLTLGPNQRFASKSAYILRPADKDPHLWIPIENARPE